MRNIKQYFNPKMIIVNLLEKKKDVYNHIYVERNNLNNYFDLFISLIMIDIRRFITKLFRECKHKEYAICHKIFSITLS